MMSFFNKRTPTGPTPDEIREQRLEDVKKLAERFTYDLALLIAGNAADVESYLAPAAATRLRSSLEPFLASGDAMRPNFGEYGELRVEGNLLSATEPIHVQVEFDDLSVRETTAGSLIPSGRRRMVLTMILDPTCRMIQDYTLRPLHSA